MRSKSASRTGDRSVTSTEISLNRGGSENRVTPLKRNPPCPRCSSRQVVKNGKIHNGKQNYKCRTCGRQFVQNPGNHQINQITKELVDKLLQENLPLAAICRITGVSGRWLHLYLKRKNQESSETGWQDEEAAY